MPLPLLLPTRSAASLLLAFYKHAPVPIYTHLACVPAPCVQVGNAELEVCCNFDYEPRSARIPTGDAWFWGEEEEQDSEDEEQLEEQPEGQQLLRLEQVSSLPSLADLLDAVHLPCGDPITGLSLRSSYCLSEAAVRKQCPQLKGATSLRVRSCSAGEGSMEAALDAILSHMPLLADLTVLSTFYCEEMPECVVELRTLTRLCWRHNGLKGLPSGPYLSGE